MSDNSLHEVHYLTLSVTGSGRGWIAPVELSPDSQQVGTYVVPLDAGGNLFPHYRLEYAEYLKNGQCRSRHSILHLRASGCLEASIDGQTICFRLRHIDGHPVRFAYVGALGHPDFQFALAEIEPESELQLDRLYAQTGIVLAGCNPDLEYAGIEAIG